MKENNIIIIIDKPVKDVFEFTTNPKNTPFWIDSISEEVAEEYPPRIGTVYKNRSEGSVWSFYKVTEFKKDAVFMLSDLEGNYFVRYTYTPLDKNRTKMGYFEWVEKGELEKPFTHEILQKLKKVIEKKRE